MATSGPGATYLVTGIATAYMDCVPVVAITGNVANGSAGPRFSFQEVEHRGHHDADHQAQLPGAAARRSWPASVREALVIAHSGRAGPVLIDVPKDVTAELVTEYVPLPQYQHAGAAGQRTVAKS